MLSMKHIAMSRWHMIDYGTPANSMGSAAGVLWWRDFVRDRREEENRWKGWVHPLAA